ncbi:MAG: alkaline phosphatase [Clostridiales bacterium]
MFKNRKGIITICISLLFIITLLFASIYANNIGYSNTNNKYHGKTPKYIFLFIGDGMSYAQINSAEIYSGKQLYGNDTVNVKRLNFTEFPVEGTCTTFDKESFIPDSASTATAIATGNKTLSGTINMDSTKTITYKPISELLKAKGYKIGVVSSVSINHATPAAFYAHQPSRNNYYDIAVELATSNFDYFGGGGFKQPTGKDNDQPDVIDIARDNGFKYVNSKEEIMSLNNNSGKVIAVNPKLDSSKALPYEIDRNENDLSLANYTKKGIDVLYNRKSEGFFMMVEAGKIDWACHANDAGASINDTLAFESSIDEAIAFQKKHPRETLIIVTGDHECGGMTLGFAGTAYETFFDEISHQTNSYLEFDKIISEYKNTTSKEDATLEDLLPVIKDSFGLIVSTDSSASENPNMVLSDFEIQKLKDSLVQTMINQDERNYDDNDKLLYGEYEPLSVTLTHILNNKAGIGWTSYSHTALPIPVYAKGIGEDIFDGSYDNTDIFKKLASIMELRVE